VPHEIKMPKFGETMTEGTINKWFKQISEEVKKGEPLFEVNTDKATLEMESPAEGILKIILVEEGETAAIGDIVAVIAEKGEKIDTDKYQPGSQKSMTASENELTDRTSRESEDIKVSIEDKIKASPAAKRLAEEEEIDLSKITPGDNRDFIIVEDIEKVKSDKIQATPVAQKIAREKEMSLSEINGTGPGGWVRKDDVEKKLADKEAKEVLAGTPLSSEDESQEIPMTGIREKVAESMVFSYRSAPHVTLTTRVDMKEAVDLKERLQEKIDQRITYTDIINLITSRALKKYPRLNAHIGENKIVIKKDINLGMAVAIKEGLVVPVINNADLLSLSELAEKREKLVEKALKGNLSPDEMQNSTFTVTNLGGQGVEIFTPIINPPEIAILGAGKITREAMVIEGNIVARPVIWLSLSFDHRAIDGAPAGEFLRYVKELMQNPLELLL